MAARVPVKERRQDLIAAAFRVMSREGIAATTTRAICTEAGVPQSVFHYCFQSKKELLKELNLTVVGDMVDMAVVASEIDGSQDVSAAMRAGFTALWVEAKAHPERQLVMYEFTTATMRDPELADLAEWQYQQYFAQAHRFVDIIAQTCEIEWTVPQPILCRMLTTAVDGVILGWLTDRNDAEVEQTLLTFADYFTSLARKVS